MNENDIRNFFYDSLSSYGLIYGKKELVIEGLRIDIFAIDKKHSPYIIEFKKSKNRHIVGQAAQYLALVPLFREQISKSINFYDINWNELTIICIAPGFLERDFISSKYEPLKGKIHFYNFEIIKNSRKQIFSLNINYAGPEKSGPLKLPKKVVDEFDIISLSEEFYKIESKEAKREYYSLKILPFLKEICNKLKYFENEDLYSHISYWNNFYTIRLGTHKTKSHRASIILGFSNKRVYFGFDLTHSLEEGLILSQKFLNSKDRNTFVYKTKALSDYTIYIPNSGFECYIPIKFIATKGIHLLLQAYKPVKVKDSYFKIETIYKGNTLKLNEVIEIFNNEYEKFKYIFDYLK